MTPIVPRLSAIISLWAILVSAAFSDQPPDLRFTEEFHDFGCVGVDFRIYHDYHLVNYGTDTIRIDTVTAHCDCSEVRFIDSIVPPGDTASFELIFNTANFYGPVQKDVRVHSSDKKSPKVYTYYRANIGQWLLSIEPKPVSIFLLPGQKSKTCRLINHALEEITLAAIEPYDDVLQIRAVKDKASKGESIELEAVPRPNLAATTHLSNFTVTLHVPDDMEPLRITIPVKVVKY